MLLTFWETRQLGLLWLSLRSASPLTDTPASIHWLAGYSSEYPDLSQLRHQTILLPEQQIGRQVEGWLGTLSHHFACVTVHLKCYYRQNLVTLNRGPPRYFVDHPNVCFKWQRHRAWWKVAPVVVNPPPIPSQLVSSSSMPSLPYKVNLYS